MLQLVNANASVIAVTSTATLLTDLIDTAAGADQQFPPLTKGCTLIPEDGDVRILFDGNTPTASKGILLKEGGVYNLSKDVDFSQLKLIRTGGSNVAVGVLIGAGLEGPLIEAGGATSGSSSGGALQSAGADAESNTASAQYTASRLYGFNGTTWDRIKAGITAVTSTLTGFLNTLPWAVYHSSPSTRTNGQGGPLESDESGNVRAVLQNNLEAVDSNGAESDSIGVAPKRRPDAFNAHFSNTSSTSDQEVKAATASKKHYITDLTISTEAEQWISIKSASTVKKGPYYMPANSVLPLHFITPVECGTNEAINVDCEGSSGVVTVDVDGYTI